MAADYEKVLGSTARPFQVQLLGADFLPVDLGPQAEVRFRIKRYPGDLPRIDADGTVVDAATGVVEYDWSLGDFDQPGDIGIYRADCVITYQDGSEDVFPSGGYWTLSIRQGEG